jgi:hypothetical protein
VRLLGFFLIVKVALVHRPSVNAEGAPPHKENFGRTQVSLD